MTETQPTTAAYNSLLVIGAGMAGLQLAAVCLRHSPSLQITILDANDYIGGRVRCCSFQGHTVEMGANWISGMDNTYENPVWRLAKDVQLTGHLVDRAEERAAIVVDDQGNDIRNEYFAIMDQFDAIHEQAIEACAKRKLHPQNDVDIRTLLQEFGWPAPEHQNKIEQLVEYNMLEVWLADSLSQVSASYNMEAGCNDVDLGKEEFFVEDTRGFNCIMRNLVQEIQAKGAVIRLQRMVEYVDYRPGHVCVRAKNLATSAEEVYSADAIVCTVSLGVLQNNKQIAFTPPLPEWKRKALNEVQMFLFSKVYVQLDHEFWSTIKNQLIFATERRGHYPLFMKYRNAKNKNLFMCYLGGPEAKRVESLTTEQIKDELEEHFRKCLGKQLDQKKFKSDLDLSAVFRPSAVAMTDWSKNPRFCGSYSSFPTKAFSTISIEDLTRGLTGTDEKDDSTTLFFAGEGYDDKFNGWVQGAYRSGERVARDILGLCK